MPKLATLTLFFFTCAITACDELDSDLDRAAVGAAIGCAAGQVFVNGRCVEGAIIGGATGALSDDF